MAARDELFTLNPRSGTPIYRQLMEQIRWLVASRELKPGDELPSVRELAVRHAVNAATISKAYMLLEAEGVSTTATVHEKYSRDAAGEPAYYIAYHFAAQDGTQIRE